MPAAKSFSRKGVAAWCFAYLAFVVYGSLVPLEFRYLPLETAWEQFRAIKLLDVGVQGRGDWISNAVLYVPLGFLALTLLGGQCSKPRRFLSACLAALICSLVAVAVEFAQLYFPDRTVSLNDLYAEFIGGAIGTALAYRRADWFLRVFFSWKRLSRDALGIYLLEAYLFLYIAFSFFPFDFILANDELQWKRFSGAWGWLIATDFKDSNSFIAVAKLFAEALAAVPMGVFLSRFRPRIGGKSAALIGCLLGVAIELGQFFVISGLSQGLSVLTRGGGVFLGWVIWRSRNEWRLPNIRSRLRRHMAFGIIGYLLVLMAVNGWFSYAWSDLAFAKLSLGQTRFLPFYYHYYTTEQAALVSVVSVGLMYVPVGIFAWLAFSGPMVALLCAALAAFVFEASKLFLHGLHPDPTNILIGGVAAWLAARALDFLASSPTHTRLMEGAVETGSIQDSAVVAGSFPQSLLPGRPEIAAAGLAVDGSDLTKLSLLMVGQLIVLGAALGFPALRGVLLLLLLINGLVLWFRPQLILVVIPAAAVCLDFSPWTGRLFFDEFDLLMVSSLLIGYARTKALRSTAKKDKIFVTATALLGFSYVMSTVIGLFPWKPIDANSFYSYYSQFNALRILKGVIWAFLLNRLISRFYDEREAVFELFSIGMTLAVAGVVTVTFWERVAFPGLLNFNDTYRVTGPFSQMHVGGADIESCLTIGTPFVVLILFRKIPDWLRFSCAVLLLGATYSVMVTFSRAGYAGFAVALLIAFAVGIGNRSSHRPGGMAKRGAAGMLLVLVVGVAGSIFFSPFAQERMALAGTDLAVREQHWADALGMRDADWTRRFFGMGLGRYPETHFWRSGEKRAAPYWLKKDGENEFLSMGSGEPMYLEQFVPISPGTNYTVRLRARSNQPAARLSISICEKWLLTSARCMGETAGLDGSGAWQTVRFSLFSGEVGEGANYSRRPTKFSIYNTSAHASIDLDDIRVEDEAGRNLLANGDFSERLDHWFFAVDNDLPWHIWSLPVQVLFDQGWIGVMAYGVFISICLLRSWQLVLKGSLVAGGVLAAGMGIVAIGIFDSLVDSPRLLLLLLLTVSLVTVIKPVASKNSRYRPASQQ